MFQKDVYECEVIVRVRVKVKTRANTVTEAFENVRQDYENLGAQEFIASYDCEELDYDESAWENTGSEEPC